MENSQGSVFSVAVRAFCKMFFGLLGLLIAFMIFTFCYSLISPSPLIEEKTMLTLVPDAEEQVELLPLTTPVILEIPIHGVIGDPQRLNAELIRNVLIDSQKGLLSNHRVKGILLHFNTPGGTVVDSDAIYQMILDYKARYKVPIFSFVEGFCASGGMMIASATDKIFAGPASLTGSVGVIWGPFFNVSTIMNTIGLQSKTFTQGIGKDSLSPTRPWTEEDRTFLDTIMAFQYNQFVDIVTKGRPKIDRTKLIQEYGAHVFDCVTAMQYGYVDQAMSTRTEALVGLLEAANLNPNEAYQVVTLLPKNPWISGLMKGQCSLLSGKIEHTFGDISMRILEQPCYLYKHE